LKVISGRSRLPPTFNGHGISKELGYVDALAREFASDTCIRCSQAKVWKTAAMMYEGMEWRYYYCYDCQRWFKRHYMYRYAVVPVEDFQAISILVRQLDLQRRMLGASLESFSWIRSTLASLRRFFHWTLPQAPAQST
jgi:hypothetical protein